VLYVLTQRRVVVVVVVVVVFIRGLRVYSDIHLVHLGAGLLTHFNMYLLDIMPNRLDDISSVVVGGGGGVVVVVVIRCECRTLCS